MLTFFRVARPCLPMSDSDETFSPAKRSLRKRKRREDTYARSKSNREAETESDDQHSRSSSDDEDEDGDADEEEDEGFSSEDAEGAVNHHRQQQHRRKTTEEDDRITAAEARCRRAAGDRARPVVDDSRSLVDGAREQTSLEQLDCDYMRAFILLKSLTAFSKRFTLLPNEAYLRKSHGFFDQAVQVKSNAVRYFLFLRFSKHMHYAFYCFHVFIIFLASFLIFVNLFLADCTKSIRVVCFPASYISGPRFIQRRNYPASKRV